MAAKINSKEHLYVFLLLLKKKNISKNCLNEKETNYLIEFWQMKNVYFHIKYDN